MLAARNNNDSQKNWDKKRRSASANPRGGRRPFDLAWRSPHRLRLFGGADSAVSSNYSYQNNNTISGGAAIITDDEGINGGHHQLVAVTTPKNNNTSNSRPSPSSATTRKMYLSPKMTAAIQHEIESLPLPATLASVAMALLNSTAIWDDYDHDASDNNFDVKKHSAVKTNDSNSNDEQQTNSTSVTAHFQAETTTDDDLSKYFSGITIEDEIQQKQILKLQFDNLCKGLITKGNFVMLTEWREVKDKLGEEFLFSTLAVDDSVVEEGEGVADAASEANEVSTETTPTTSTPMSKRRRRSLHKSSKIPKKSHPTSPKPTQRRTNIKLKRVMGRAFAHGGAKKKATLRGLDSYKQQLLDKMGKSKYNQMFQQATISPTKHLLLLDDTAQRLDDKIAQLESERRKTKQDELLEKAEQEHEARESASKLLRTLTPEETQIVNNAVYGIGPRDDILASQDADSVQRESMHRLQPGQWLNDEIINYFLKNCLAKRDENLCAKQAERKRSHFFNSFFVQTMFDEKNSNYSLRGKYNYKNVRRWSKKVPGKDAFNLKYIFCPINLDNMHWTSACIFMEQKKIQYYDSMGGTDWSKLEGLLEYLKDEWKAKKKGEEMDWSEWELVGCQEGTPRQLNGEFVFVLFY